MSGRSNQDNTNPSAWLVTKELHAFMAEWGLVRQGILREFCGRELPGAVVALVLFVDVAEWIFSETWKACVVELCIIP